MFRNLRSMTWIHAYSSGIGIGFVFYFLTGLSYIVMLVVYFMNFFNLDFSFFTFFFDSPEILDGVILYLVSNALPPVSRGNVASLDSPDAAPRPRNISDESVLNDTVFYRPNGRMTYSTPTPAPTLTPELDPDNGSIVSVQPPRTPTDGVPADPLISTPGDRGPLITPSGTDATPGTNPVTDTTENDNTYNTDTDTETASNCCD